MAIMAIAAGRDGSSLTPEALNTIDGEVIALIQSAEFTMLLLSRVRIDLDALGIDFPRSPENVQVGWRPSPGAWAVAPVERWLKMPARNTGAE
jgi:hypothetical protein